MAEAVKLMGTLKFHRITTLAIIIGIVAVSLVIGSLIAEGVLRITHREFLRSKKVVCNRYWGWHYAPRLDFLLKNKSGRFIFETNSRGLRGSREYSYKKPKGVYRILVLGDSFMAAENIRYRKSFCSMLEDDLHYKQKRRVEVINTGCAGYGTDNEFLFFKHEGYKYNPDLVILAFLTANDIFDNSNKFVTQFFGDNRKPYFKVNNEGNLQLINLPYECSSGEKDTISKLKGFLRNNLVSYRFIGDKIKNNYRLHRFFVKLKLIKKQQIYNDPSSIPIPYLIYAKEYTSDWINAWYITKKIVIKLNKAVKETGGIFVVVILTNPEQVHFFRWENILRKHVLMNGEEYDLQKPVKVIKRLCKRYDIRCLDLLPYFKKENIEKEVLLHSIPEDPHWNIKGHALAAKIVSNNLVSNVLQKQ